MFAQHLTLNNAKGLILTGILFAISGKALFGYDDADLLNDAAATYRANLDSLTSLAGHVSVVRESNRDGKTSVSKRTIRFAHDWRSGGEYFFSKTDSPVMVAPAKLQFWKMFHYLFVTHVEMKKARDKPRAANNALLAHTRVRLISESPLSLLIGESPPIRNPQRVVSRSGSLG